MLFLGQRPNRNRHPVLNWGMMDFCFAVTIHAVYGILEHVPGMYLHLEKGVISTMLMIGLINHYSQSTRHQAVQARLLSLSSPER